MTTIGLPWRIGFDDRSTMESAPGGKPLDEVVIDGLIHVEMLHGRCYFVEIAGLAFWVYFKRGKWVITGREDRRPKDQRTEIPEL